ncbi:MULTISPECIES: DoxX family protein [unclassified Rhodococcus (in: high G+C Gram-positive bacteria)]|jgi:putative oxidoreductase|uniref:DoxX family protein n=1 Tax=unclassified Rhodococcus (in: high G+C Gram-positive bacteria) TaxID=192944 RepID=UPI0002F7A141|nr:DoxX family protein [Rhodococcus sp. DK17]
MNGIELARIGLRTVVGTTMVAHGVKHGRTLDGTAGWFESIGFRQPQIQARASAIVEVGAGAALIAGIATPVAASAVVATMAVAARTVHKENGFFITSEGYEYVLNLAMASVAVSALGPGRWSVDRLIRADSRSSGMQRAAVTAGLGVAAAATQLAVFWRRPPRRL